MVDLISIFSDPWSNLKTVKILFSNPHTSTSLVTGDQHVAIHVEASNNAFRNMCFHDHRACDSSLLRGPVEIREIKTLRKFRFLIIGANPQNIVPTKSKMSTYTVYIPLLHIPLT